MSEVQDILVAAGPVSGGKTHTVGLIMAYLEEHGIPYDPVPIRDGQYFNALRKDHQQTGGKNHDHEWCRGVSTGHVDNDHTVDFTWRITGYPLVQTMWSEFTDSVSSAPRDGRWKIVEWSGAAGEPPDRSFAGQVQEFETGRYNKSFFPRIRAVFHPILSYDGRVALNDFRSRHKPDLEVIQKGMASWAVPNEVMPTFRHDDFDILRAYLEKYGVRSIFNIKNDARVEGERIESHFDERIEEKLALIFPRRNDIETNKPSLREGRGR